MHDVSFPVTFISASSGSKPLEDGSNRPYFVCSLLAADGNIDRFFVSSTVFDSLKACMLGDKLEVNAKLYYAPKSSSWALKVDSINPTV